MTLSLDADFYRALVARAADAIIVADADGIIRLWNEGAARIFGFAAAEALGQSLDLIIPEGLRARHWAGFNQTMATGESRYGGGDVLAVPARRQDGSRISVEFTIVPFHDAEGRIAGIAAFLRDVSARFEEVKSLRRQLAERGGAL